MKLIPCFASLRIWDKILKIFASIQLHKHKQYYSPAFALDPRRRMVNDKLTMGGFFAEGINRFIFAEVISFYGSYLFFSDRIYQYHDSHTKGTDVRFFLFGAGFISLL